MGDAWGRIRAVVSSPVIRLLLAAALLAMLRGNANEGKTATALEKRIGKMLSQAADVGRVEVIIRTQRIDEIDTPCGAMVFAQGAQDPVVRMEMTQALCALLGLQAADVSVIGVWEGE